MSSTTVSAPMYEYSIVPFLRTLKNLRHIFDKAEAHAKEKGEDVEEYIKLQVYPDMKDFGYQIQRLSDSAKFVLVRVAGANPEPLAMPDTEKTWAEYAARVDRTISILEGASASDFFGKEDTSIELFGGKYKMTAVPYLQTFAIPNFYFHVVTAYDLLRGKGVPIGKMDYLVGNHSMPAS